MIKAEQVPDAVGEAAMNAVKNDVHDPKAVVAAALNAWPGFWIHPYTKTIILPLTENSNERE